MYILHIVIYQVFENISATFKNLKSIGYSELLLVWLAWKINVCNWFWINLKQIGIVNLLICTYILLSKRSNGCLCIR